MAALSACWGRNMVLSAVREMPIVGGSGAFRFARGYAQAKTYSFDVQTGDAAVEYNAEVTQRLTSAKESSSKHALQSHEDLANKLQIVERSLIELYSRNEWGALMDYNHGSPCPYLVLSS
ncbi:hypothetical protein JHK87_007355 [Glycine soja]|nr:hypothetical protein JHK87_007355 [Glycine soja]